MSEWVEYTGSDKQIEELRNAKDGFVLEIIDVGHECGTEQTGILLWKDSMMEQLHADSDGMVQKYLICDPHPLADMIFQQARTGQPVYVRMPHDSYWNTFGIAMGYELLTENTSAEEIIVTHKPNWNIHGAQYRFTPFED